MFIRTLAAVAMSACLAACDTPPTSSSETNNPVGPSGVSDPQRPAPVSGATTPRAVGASTNVVINMLDNCDPDTFNATIGPGTCVRSGGGVRFDDFIAQLTRLGFVGSWHFSRPVTNARVGQNLVLTNRGGEVHTFTEVEEFGGGILANLNELAGVPDVAPECLNLAPGDFVAPGHTITETEDEEGDEKYQCCLHPWMRLDLHVTEK
jgi:hypothetical protein